MIEPSWSFPPRSIDDLEFDIQMVRRRWQSVHFDMWWCAGASLLGLVAFAFGDQPIVGLAYAAFESWRLLRSTRRARLVGYLVFQLHAELDRTLERYRQQRREKP